MTPIKNPVKFSQQVGDCADHLCFACSQTRLISRRNRGIATHSLDRKWGRIPLDCRGLPEPLNNYRHRQNS